jgi:hypothetical protein
VSFQKYFKSQAEEVDLYRGQVEQSMAFGHAQQYFFCGSRPKQIWCRAVNMGSKDIGILPDPTWNNSIWNPNSALNSSPVGSFAQNK